MCSSRVHGEYAGECGRMLGIKAVQLKYESHVEDGGGDVQNSSCREQCRGLRTEEALRITPAE
jgi:hypothetical protein